jgi:hypothetical protein
VTTGAVLRVTGTVSYAALVGVFALLVTAILVVT